MPRLRTHKGFSDIEAAITRYYEDGTVDALTTALSVAGVALSIAQPLIEEADMARLQTAKELVFSLLVHREWERSRP